MRIVYIIKTLKRAEFIRVFNKLARKGYCYDADWRLRKASLIIKARNGHPFLLLLNADPDCKMVVCNGNHQRFSSDTKVFTLTVEDYLKLKLYE